MKKVRIKLALESDLINHIYDKNVKKEYLNPFDWQKSYYKKAVIKYDNKVVALYSYDALIAIYFKNKKLLIASDYWNYSATTRKHEYSFLNWLQDRYKFDAYDVYDRLRLEGEEYKIS